MFLIFPFLFPLEVVLVFELELSVSVHCIESSTRLTATAELTRPYTALRLRSPAVGLGPIGATRGYSGHCGSLITGVSFRCVW